MAAALDDLGTLPQVQIRPMLESDVPAIVELERLSYPFPWSEGIFRDCVRVGYTCRVLDLDGQVMGYGVMSTGAGEAHILNVCVRPTFRTRGLGKRLLEHLMDRAAGSGMLDIFLEVRPTNTAAIRLYQSLAFEQVGIRRGYYQAAGGREDAVVLRASLRGRRPRAG
ncbi:MAG TPA: ribosomal protein S18-alanine N-acetyltransferase [Steroidobacteraceae bacterium]|nr:ribosomal protein S18-alanine N-acetyltransferase [Steroidobacteraceae bacterium]